MRVLMHARPGSQRILAGDAVQARATAETLRRLGVAVDLAEEDLPDPAPYDLVHLLNLMPIESTHRAFLAARRLGKPVALSPVFWDPRAFLTGWEAGGDFVTWWERTEPQRREVLAGASVILPNSLAELDCLERTFGPPLPPHVIVPNGVDVGLFRPGLRTMDTACDVLCVARISPRKNQLGLLNALRGSGRTLRFIGPVNDFQYYRACRAAAWTGVSFLPERAGARLAASYAAGRVHALVSWYETPGLASLEAAACGCRVVSTELGCAREYLAETAWYCRPDDIDGIRHAVEAALAAPAAGGAAEFVRARYNWEQAALATLAGYELALEASEYETDDRS